MRSAISPKPTTSCTIWVGIEYSSTLTSFNLLLPCQILVQVKGEQRDFVKC